MRKTLIIVVILAISITISSAKWCSLDGLNDDSCYICEEYAATLDSYLLLSKNKFS